MDTITDPIDILNILVEDTKEELGDKYKTVINLLKRFRLITGGNTCYIKKQKTKWETINTLWEQYKHTDKTKGEIEKQIATTLEISPYTVRRIILEIQKGNQI